MPVYLDLSLPPALVCRQEVPNRIERQSHHWFRNNSATIL